MIFRVKDIRFLVIMMVLFLNSENRMTGTQACKLPLGLKFSTVHVVDKLLISSDFISGSDERGFRFDVPNRHYRFDLDGWLTTNQFNSCNQVQFTNSMSVKFPKRFILENRFNLSGLIDFLLLFANGFKLYLTSLEAIEVDLGLNYNASYDTLNRSIINFAIQMHNSRLDFRINGKPVEACQQFFDANLTEPKSIFRIAPNQEFISMSWINPTFVRPLCPLLFKHARFTYLDITGIIDTFYKQNLLSFTNETFEEYLDSWILSAWFVKCENIELDAKLLNPYVFSELESKQYNNFNIKIYFFIYKILKYILFTFLRFGIFKFN